MSGWIQAAMQQNTISADQLIIQTDQLIIQKRKLDFSITKSCRYLFEAAVFKQERLLYCTFTPKAFQSCFKIKQIFHCDQTSCLLSPTQTSSKAVTHYRAGRTRGQVGHLSPPPPNSGQLQCLTIAIVFELIYT